MQLQLVASLLPAHAALHVQSVNVHRDVLYVFRRDPGPSSNTRGTVRNFQNASTLTQCQGGPGATARPEAVGDGGHADCHGGGGR